MSRFRPWTLAVAALTAPVFTWLAVAPARDEAGPGSQVVRAAALPLVFEANGGRTDPRARFISHGEGYTLFVTPTESVWSLGGGRSVVRTRLVGARPARVAGRERLPGTVNSLVGRRSDWRTGIPAYGRVASRGVYPGIDLVHHGDRGRLEYDFVVAPGADPRAIELAVRGAQRVSLDARGDLVMQTASGVLRQHRPVAYQGRDRVEASFRLTGNRVRFQLGDWDRSRPLVIDPIVTYAVPRGGNAIDVPRAIAVDSAGSAYITGSTDSSDYPTTAGAADTSYGGIGDAFVTKLTPSGTGIVYSTYVGGTGQDYSQDIEVDSAGSAYIAGYGGSGLGVTATIGAGGGGDAFVAKLNPSGSSLAYFTRVGGTGADYFYGIAVDSSGNAYAAGSTASTNYPVDAPDVDLPGEDAVLTKINAAGTARGYSRYLGGDGFDRAYGVDERNGEAYVAGTTSSSNFPLASAFDTSPTGGTATVTNEAFITKFNTAGTSRVYSTYYGGNGYDLADAIAVGPTGDVWIAGSGDSSTHIATSGLNSTPQPGGSTDTLVAHLHANGTMIAGGYLGGNGVDAEVGFRNGVATDAQGNGYITGKTSSTDTAFSHRATQSTNGGADDAFVVKLGSTSNPATLFKTYHGGESGEHGEGIATGPEGSFFVAGTTNSIDYPSKPAGPEPAADGDGFVVKYMPFSASFTSGPDGPTDDSTPQFGFGAGEQGSTYECRVDGAAFAVCPDIFTTAPLADGPHTFDVRALDQGGTPGPSVRKSFAVDTVPPAEFGLIGPGPGEATGSQPVFTWNETSDSGTSVTGYTVVVDGQPSGAGACSGGTCSYQPSMPIPDGEHTWRVSATDAFGHVRDSETRPFTVAAAPVAKLAIAPNPALVGRAVTFDASGSADNGPIAAYDWDLDGNGTFETSTGSVPATTGTYPQAATIKVSVRVTDGGGLAGEASGNLTVNAIPGQVQFGISVNNGAQFTNDPDVRVSANFPLVTSSILLSNDGGFGGAKSFLPAPSLPWRLESSGPERLPKTVYARFLPSAVQGLTFQDDIILDETPPKVTAATVAGASSAGAGTARAARAFKLRVRASDNVSGVRGLQVTANKRRPGRLKRYRRTLRVSAAKLPLYVRAKDRAGNFSRWRKAR